MCLQKAAPHTLTGWGFGGKFSTLFKTHNREKTNPFNHSINTHTFDWYCFIL